jgi:hypothetical protein
MHTWTLTTDGGSRYRTVIGAADSPEQARGRVTAAAGAAIGRAAASGARPRYTLHVDGQLIAIIAPADNELGLADHAAAAALLAEVDRQRNPFQQ